MKLNLIATAISALAAGACASSPGDALEQDAAGAYSKEHATVKVMVLGAYHMSGGGKDVVNMKVDDVRSPRRQAELSALAGALATFRPTVIVTERVTAAPLYADPGFTAFTDESLATVADERVQIGYRLARIAGVERVHGVDEKPEEGEPDYFPFGAVMARAAASDRSAYLEAIIGEVQRQVSDFESRQASDSVPELLIPHNTTLGKDHSFYFALSAFDVGEDQPGAELQAYWFMRNAKIFSKIMQVTRPGDRVVVVYGSGHKYWLDHLVTETPGFELVDPVPYLKRATAAAAVD